MKRIVIPERFSQGSILRLVLLWIPAFAGMTLLMGCQTAPKPAPRESQQEVVSALGTVTQGLTNQNVSDQDLRKLAVKVQKDPEARSALQEVNGALGAQQSGVSYCPKCGRRFSSRIKFCPFDGAELKPVE